MRNKEPNTYYGKFPPHEDKNRTVRVIKFNKSMSDGSIAYEYEFVETRHIQDYNTYLLGATAFYGCVYTRLNTTALQKWWQKRNFISFQLRGMIKTLQAMLHNTPLTDAEYTFISTQVDALEQFLHAFNSEEHRNLALSSTLNTPTETGDQNG